MNPRPNPADFAEFNDAALYAEQTLIGGCLFAPSVLASVVGEVEAEFFSEPLHREIWSVMTELASEGRAVTGGVIVARLGNVAIGDIKLSEYLARCASETVASPAYAADFARHVRENYCARRLAILGEDMRAAALMPGTRARELVTDLLQEADAIRGVLDLRRSQGRAAGELAERVVEDMQAQMQGVILDNLISTGLADLDRKLGGGLKAGDLVVIAGRPGMGKTMLAASMARQAARAGHAGAFFSLEMPEQQIGARLTSDEAFGGGENSVTSNQILRGQVSDAQAQRVVDAARAMRSLPLIIEAPPVMTVGEVSARTRAIADRFKRAGKRLGCIFIDYLKFLKASDRYRGQRHYEIGEITAGLKALAKDMGIAVVLCAQINREVEKLSDKRPTLAHLRESGDIEADADVVLLLYREAYYLENDPEVANDPVKLDKLDRCRHELEIIIGKNRMGPTGKVPVYCHPGASAVRNIVGV